MASGHVQSAFAPARGDLGASNNSGTTVAQPPFEGQTTLGNYYCHWKPVHASTFMSQPPVYRVDDPSQARPRT